MVLVLVILLISSSFFSATETALVSLGKLKTKEIIEEKRFYILQNWLDNPAESISGILVGNNIVNILFSVLFTYWALKSPLFSDLGRGLAEILILTVVVLLILFFGEIIPKTFAHAFPERIVLLTYRPFFFIFRLLSPLVKFFVKVAEIFVGMKLSLKATKVTREELEGLMAQEREEGVIEKKAEEMIDESLFYAFVRLNMPDGIPEFWIVPSSVVATVIKKSQKIYMETPKKDGSRHKETKIREFHLETYYTFFNTKIYSFIIILANFIS